MNILISAYACEPNRGGETEIGWCVVNELAKRHNVWVLTRANNAAIHEAEFKKNGKPKNLVFIYYDTPYWARFYKKGKRLFLVYYYLWQLASYFVARRFLRTIQIDLVHHLTGAMDWMPSGVSLLGRLFVWGSVGSEEIHSAIWSALPLRIRLREVMRKIVRFYGRHIDPFVHLTAGKANIILSHCPENSPWRYRHKIVPAIQTGIIIDERYHKRKKNFRRGDPFTVIYAGRLIHWKGAHFAAEAFSRFASDKVGIRLIVIGDGALRGSMVDTFKQYCVLDIVEFKGTITMQELIDILGTGDVFLYPSYHHGLATVILQAMLMGLPVVCIEGDATGKTVGSECGIVVEVSQNKDFVDGLAYALNQLYMDESLCIKLSRKAQKRVLESYNYAVIAQSFESVYKDIFAIGADKNKNLA